MIPPIVIRPSSLPQYPDCQRRTASRLFPHQIAEWGYSFNVTPKNIGAMIGTATHTAAGWLLDEKIRTGEIGNLSEAEDRGVESLKYQRDGADISYDATTPNVSTGQLQIIRMIKRYRMDVAPKAKPTAVEQELSFTTGLGNKVVGHLDLTEDGPRDLKTGTQQRMNIAQYGAYSMLLRANGMPSLQVIEDYLRRVKIKEEQPPVQTTYYDLYLSEDVSASIIKSLERSYALFMENGKPGEFLANPNSVLCGEKFCGCFHSDFCPESKAKAKKES